ncbi:Uncharacterised protein [Chlamydia abortus]|nr:Uncharacterised protein [Chlamydia abortus]
MVRETVVKASNFFCQESDSGRRMAQTHKKDDPTQPHGQEGDIQFFLGIPAFRFEV